MKKGIDGILKASSHKHWVEQVIDEALERDNTPRPFSEAFHPSGAGDCPRLIQLKMFGLVKNDVDYKLQRIFDNGNYVHERFSSYFNKMGKLVDKEVQARFHYKGVFVSGRADIVVQDYENKPHVGEMKSINNRRYTEVLILNAPMDDHFLQWNIYAYALKMPEGFILYENKDDQRIQIFTVQFNDEKFNRVMNKFAFINSCNKESKLVPKPEPCPDGRFCAAASFCRNPDQKLFNDAITGLMLKNLSKQE